MRESRSSSGGWTDTASPTRPTRRTPRPRGASAGRCAATMPGARSTRDRLGGLVIRGFQGVDHGLQGQAVNSRPARGLRARPVRAARRPTSSTSQIDGRRSATVQGRGHAPYLVNIDAVDRRAATQMLGRPYHDGTPQGRCAGTATFTIFLYAPDARCAAEIHDHLNRGHDMDTRTPASSTTVA